MRKWVDIYLSELATIDNSVRLIIADVGDFPKFSSSHPEKFLNVGVSESNAIGIAAGLASEGLNVFVYGVSSFFLYRAYEQFKYSVAYWCQRVTFIGVGFGWKYYNIGTGHFCPDDIQLVRCLPHFQCHTPFTLTQLKQIVFHHSENPRYIRLTANYIDESDIDSFSFNNCDDPENPIIFSYGEMVKTSVEICKEVPGIQLLALDEINDSILNSTVQLKSRKIIVIEDQYKYSGLGAIMAYNGFILYRHFCLPLESNKVALTREELMEKYKLDKLSIIAKL